MTPLLSFGTLLRSFRNKCNDPLTGRRLSQERLGQLIGEEVGSAYTAQAVSDWERDRSQIHKDHRQVLIALVNVLHDLGGIKSIDDAEHLLAVGNYRALDKEELNLIFGVEKLESMADIRKKYWELQLTIFREWIKRLDLITVSKSIAWILSWFAAYLGISPVLDFSVRSQTDLISVVIKLTLTCLVLPIMIAWCSPNEHDIPHENTAPLATFLLRVIGSTLGFSLGVLNLLTLALVSYNLYLYPWPSFIPFVLSLWPILLGSGSIKLIFSHYFSAYGRIAVRDYRILLLTFLIPALLGMEIYIFHDLLLSRITGPLLLILTMSGLGVVFYAQTRRTP